jgi:shikimate dehydrogenase
MDQGAQDIRVLNRTFGKAQALAHEFGSVVTAYDWDERHEAISDCVLLINTTSLGMHGQAALEIELSQLPHSAMVSDAIYVPLETPLLAQARARGHTTVNGLGMLLHQARPAFHAWFDVMPDVTAELRQAVIATL